MIEVNLFSWILIDKKLYQQSSQNACLQDFKIFFSVGQNKSSHAGHSISFFGSFISSLFNDLSIFNNSFLLSLILFSFLLLDSLLLLILIISILSKLLVLSNIWLCFKWIFFSSPHK